MSEFRTPRIAILASGSGSTAEALIRTTTTNRKINTQVGLVICNNPPEKAGVYRRVAQLNDELELDLDVLHISGATHPEGRQERGQTLAESAAICKAVADYDCGHVALLGYMKQVNGDLMEEFGWRPGEYTSTYQARMTNTHPGPLPLTKDTFGIKASEIALREFKAGAIPFSEHTVHLVAPDIDDGPIIARHRVTIFPSDTPEELFQRVQITEKERLPFVLDTFLEGQAYYNETH